MTTPAPDLVELARAYDVATDYWDWRGEHVEVSTETIAAVLTAMGVDVADPAAALADRHEQPWRRMLPACVVATEAQPQSFWVHVTHGDPVEVWVELETGGRREDISQLEHWVAHREVAGRLV